jgi:glutamate/tyrosine decarboxylase-like PLP-dependent enzyme
MVVHILTIPEWVVNTRADLIVLVNSGWLCTPSWYNFIQYVRQHEMTTPIGSDNPMSESLDPQDWQPVRQLGHRMIDDLIDYLADIENQGAWKHAPDAVKAHFTTPVPLEPQPLEAVYQEFLEFIQPYPVGNGHPRFWGWLFGTGTATGALAEMLAAGMNSNSGDLDHHSAIHVETQLLNWCKSLLGFPEGASGVITGGCSAANLLALTTARNTKAGYDIRAEGVQDDLVVYASSEIHSSVQKSIEMLGLGRRALRKIAVDDSFQMDLEALAAAITADREAGNRPICVVAAAGTVNTGAIDDIESIADLCAAEDLWLHVDGAFGAWAALLPEYDSLLRGLRRADSLAFDLHKWMYINFEVAGVLVRDAEAHRSTFSYTPAYLESQGSGRGLTGGGDLPWIADYDFQLSRSFRSLKAWMTLKEHGIRKFERLIRQNIDQALYLGARIDAHPDFELAAPVSMNVVAFRYVRPGQDEAWHKRLNEHILAELQEQGLAVLSSTTIRDQFYLRAGITNHRSTLEDFDRVIEDILILVQT